MVEGKTKESRFLNSKKREKKNPKMECGQIKSKTPFPREKVIRYPWPTEKNPKIEARSVHVKFNEKKPVFGGGEDVKKKYNMSFYFIVHLSAF